MSKFCAYCGQPMTEGTSFCTSCGKAQPQNGQSAQAPQQQFGQNTQIPQQPQQFGQNAQASQQQYYQQGQYIGEQPEFAAAAAPAKKSPLKLIIIIAIAAVVAIGGTFAGLYFGGVIGNHYEDNGSTYETPVEGLNEICDDYISSGFELDSISDDSFDKILPEKLLDSDKYRDARDDIKSKLEDDMLSQFSSDDLKEAKKILNNGFDIDVEFKIKDKEKLDDDKLDEFKEKIEDKYDADADVTEGYNLKMEVDIKIDYNGKEESITKEGGKKGTDVYKVNGAWVDGNSLLGE